jgi:hypothetical protein
MRPWPNPWLFRLGMLTTCDHARRQTIIESPLCDGHGCRMKRALEPVFAALQGEWSLQRHIWQDNAVTPLIFAGHAAFVAGDGAGYAYEESGNIDTQVGVLPLRRRYAFEYDAAADTIVVRYWDDGPAGPLHSLRCGGASMTAAHRHVCGEDVYDVTYDFTDMLAHAPAFVCAYAVQGPHKDYRMRSVFRRVG